MAGRAGFALVSVLWVLVLVSALGLAAGLSARDALAVARNRTDLVRAAWLAEGCVERARAAIDEVLGGSAPGARPAGWAALDRLVPASPHANGPDCDLELRAGASTLDANTVDAATLGRLFAVLGVDEARADSMVDALLDWRDADDIARPYGAEAPWYLERGRHPPRDGPLADARELLRVRGLDGVPGLLDVLGVEPGPVSVNHAPAPVLAALPGIGPDIAAAIIAARHRGAVVRDLREIGPASAAGYAELARMAAVDPAAWTVIARSRVGAPPATAAVEVRLVRAGGRAAVVRRRTWWE